MIGNATNFSNVYLRGTVCIGVYFSFYITINDERILTIVVIYISLDVRKFIIESNIKDLIQFAR